jgi:hypothetical protein
VPNDATGSFKFLAIKDWDRTQGTMRNGNIIRAWVRDFVDRDNDPEYSKLTPTQRYVVDGCCRLRGRFGRNLVNDPSWIVRALCVAPSDRGHAVRAIASLIGRGFLLLTNEEFHTPKGEEKIYGKEGSGEDTAPPQEPKDRVPGAAEKKSTHAIPNLQKVQEEMPEEPGEIPALWPDDGPTREPADDPPNQAVAIANKSGHASQVRHRELTNEQTHAIYLDYPRRVAPKRANDAISKAASRLLAGEDVPPTGPLSSIREVYEYLCRRVRLFRDSADGQAGKFTPHPATWFNDHRYLDDEAEWNRDDRTGGRKHEHVSRSRRNIESAITLVDTNAEKIDNRLRERLVGNGPYRA